MVTTSLSNSTSTTTTTTTIPNPPPPPSSSSSSSSSPTQKFSLPSLPPFPETIPIAPLLRLSLSKLLTHQDIEEKTRLIRACEDLGFFYLDLSAPPSTTTLLSSNEDFLGERLLRDADELFLVGEELYELPIEEKEKYDFMHLKSYFGYKGLGANVVDKDGNLDRNEFYNVSKDDIFEFSDRWPAPEVLDSQRALLKSFMLSAHKIVELVLTLLNEHLGLPTNTLNDLHRLNGRSGDQVRFMKAPPQPMDDRKISLGEHTDFGSVTVLFNRLGGLQVLPPGKDAQWCYVKPLPNHAIINLGDAMVKFTNGLLRSNIHRVISPPGSQADTTRYSLVYFARPENHVMMKRLEGSDKIPQLDEDEMEEDINAQDWITRRALGHRHAVHGKNAFDFGSLLGTEKLSRRDDS